jgi:glutathione S-transferase
MNGFAYSGGRLSTAGGVNSRVLIIVPSLAIASETQANFTDGPLAGGAMPVADVAAACAVRRLIIFWPSDSLPPPFWREFAPASKTFGNLAERLGFFGR